MKKIFALLLSVAMVASLFVGVAFAAGGTYTVAYKTGASTAAGANSTLVFTVTPPVSGTATTVKVDFAASGFVPIGAATWAGSTNVTSNIVGNVITIARTENITTGTVEIPVRNPLTAKVVNQAVSADAFVVTTGTPPTALVVATSVSVLNVNYTVTPSITTPVIGGTSTVSFNVTQGGAAVTDALVYNFYRGLTLLTHGSTSTGNFSAAISFTAEPGAFSQEYTVNVAKATDTTVTGSTKLTALYNLTVDGITTVKYLDARTLTGRLTNAAGTGIANAPITLRNKTNASDVANATTAADGSFAMTAVFADAAVYAFNVGTVEYSTFTVAGLDLTVAAAPTSIVKTLGTTAMTFTVRLPGTTTTPTNANPEIRILNPDGTVRLDWTSTLVWSAPADLATGTYKVEARWEDTANGNTPTVSDRTGSTTFAVTNPSKLNVSYAPTVAVDGVLTVGANGVAITIRDVAGAGFVGATATAAQIKQVLITVTGPLTSAVTINTAVTAPGAAAPWNGSLITVTPTFNIEQAGNIVVTGTVTFGDNSTETFTRTYTNNGWIVTTEKVLGTVGDVVTLRAVVTTAAGVPVNNAIVTWTGVANAFLTAKDAAGVWITPAAAVPVDGSITNINNGVYEKEVKLNTNGDVTVGVTTTALAARASLVANITGQNVYTVTPSVSSVIATLATQTVRVAVTNASGAAMTNLQALDVTGSTGVLAAPLAITDATMYDANADGIVDGYQFSVSPLASGTLTITAKTDNGNKIGVGTVAVVAPGVTVTAAAKATQNVTEKLNVKVNDMTGTPAAARPISVRVTAVGAFMELKTDVATPVILTNGTVENQAHLVAAAAAEHKLLVTAWDFVEATPVAPLVRVEVSYNGTNWVKAADLAVTPLDITLNSDTIFVGGVNKIDATVTDAHGVAYAGKAVAVAGSTGTTDANGKVSLFVNPSSTGTATLTVATSRTGVTANKTITITADSVKPAVAITSAPVSEKATYLLTGTFSDNLGVANIYVNGAPIPFIAALGTFERTVTLVDGANVFTVFAFDAAGNGATTSITVSYAAPITPAPVKDTTLPTIVIAAPATVATDFTVVTVTATDAGGLAQVVINNVPKFFIPGNTAVVTERISLNEGPNVVTVNVADVAGNWATSTRTITYTKPTPPPAPVPVTHVITIGKADPAFGLDVPAVAKNGRLMVPFRWFGERILGATVDYKVVAGVEIVTLHKGGTHVELTLNSAIAKVNGVAVALDVAAYAEAGRTLVPARFLAEAFGYKIEWHPATNNVTITK
ncbi:MAG: Ig-like domain-containing protein [Bacillota bacterium]|nr:MAG: Ig-like domain-containing protein [Bacillota bacterium]